MSKSSNWESTIKPIVVLSVISLIASLLLALVNGMTAPVIAENTKRTTLAAYVGVLPSVSDASELEEVTDYTTAGITGVVKAPDGSTAIKAEEKGFEGGTHAQSAGNCSGNCQNGAGTQNQTQNGVFFDNAVGKDAYLGLIFLCHFLPTSFYASSLKQLIQSLMAANRAVDEMVAPLYASKS